jgi:hypothetical protein
MPDIEDLIRQLREYVGPLTAMKLANQAADALEGQWYGSYITAAEGTTQEELESAVKEHAIKTLIEMGALQIILHMTPEPSACDDGSVGYFVTGAWKIRLPKETSK